MCPCTDYLLWATIDTILLIKQAEDGGKPGTQSFSQASTKPLASKFHSCGTVR